MAMQRDVIRSMLPCLGFMHEFCFNVPRSVRELDVLLRQGTSTITTFATSFRDPDMSPTIPFLYLLVKLRDLRIEFEPVSHIAWPNDDQPFPERQLLEVSGPERRVTSVLYWIKDTSMPELCTLRLEICDNLSRGLFDFGIMASSTKNHSANMTVFGLTRIEDTPAKAVFPHTPRLRYVEFHSPNQQMELLHHLPATVINITCPAKIGLERMLKTAVEYMVSSRGLKEMLIAT
jgi:hypothetical protein